jgi:hypothetical protein
MKVQSSPVPALPCPAVPGDFNLLLLDQLLKHPDLELVRVHPRLKYKSSTQETVHTNYLIYVHRCGAAMS